MADLHLLSNHGRALVCVARDPDSRLRDIADCLGITERSPTASSPTSSSTATSHASTAARETTRRSTPTDRPPTRCSATTPSQRC